MRHGDSSEFERRLFFARKAFERGGTDTYVCSLSTRTLVYKALCTGRTLHEFYPDLQNKQYATHFAVFHQRYATNVLAFVGPRPASAHGGAQRRDQHHLEQSRARRCPQRACCRASAIRSTRPTPPTR